MAETQRHLVLVEDDASFAATLRRSFERRGYRVSSAASHEDLKAVLASENPGYAVVDLKLNGSSGLVCVQTLHDFDSGTIIVVLTGFASIATAVEAVKLGARYYLAKPASTDDIDVYVDGKTDIVLRILHEAGVAQDEMDEVESLNRLET